MTSVATNLGPFSDETDKLMEKSKYLKYEADKHINEVRELKANISELKRKNGSLYKTLEHIQARIGIYG